MAKRYECDRCHRIFSNKLDKIQFCDNAWEGSEEFELCRDCKKGAIKWLKQYLKN